jgi:hypothetical protein
MEALKTLKEKILGTDEQNKAASERMKNNPMEKKFQKMMGNEPKDEKDRESIRVDRSPKYSNSQMASTRKQLEGQAKALKPELDKASEDYDKAIGKAKGGMIKSSASKRADGCAVRGKTKGRMV